MQLRTRSSFFLCMFCLFVFNTTWKKCFIAMPHVWVLMSSACRPFYIWQILASIHSKKLKDNYSITSLSELLCSDSGKSWVGAHIFRQERICIEESSCQWPATGGPSGSALRWQSQQTVRQKHVGNQTLLIPRICLIFELSP